MNKKIVLIVLLCFYTLILLIGAFSTGVAEKPFFDGFDKALHFTAFFLFSLLLMLALSSYNYKHKEIKAFTISLLLGLFIEITQIFIPNRSFSTWDLLADLAGIIIGILAAKIILKK